MLQRLFVFLIFLIFPLSVLAQTKQIIGWTEKVKIFPGDLVIHAKIDSGADTSSLHASEVHEIDKDGERWVRFDVINRYGKKTTIERPVHRIAVIKRHNGKFEKRQVIRLGICLGTVYLEADVTLVDRTNFDYQMLIGKSYLAGNSLIDPAISYTAEPHCKGVPKS